MARRPVEVAAEVKAALDAGTREARNLAEALAVDFAALLAAVAPGADIAAMRAAAGEGVLARMRLGARLAAAVVPAARLASHPSDTVRGWAAHALAAEAEGLAEALARMRPLAEDPNSGVREWAWMAVRPRIAAELSHAIALLRPWTGAPHPGARRFATEATRPRGVWCAHIPALRADPRPGLVLLDPLRADPEKYVQDSVANWLNDAAKDSPDWVREVCARWAGDSQAPSTARIVRRALRSL